ncbi:MAG: hypothetical protein ACI9J4_001153 [Paraglaciecola sp.]|jgi:hypothetical protein
MSHNLHLKRRSRLTQLLNPCHLKIKYSLGVYSCLGGAIQAMRNVNASSLSIPCEPEK